MDMYISSVLTDVYTCIIKLCVIEDIIWMKFDIFSTLSDEVWYLQHVEQLLMVFRYLHNITVIAHKCISIHNCDSSNWRKNMLKYVPQHILILNFKHLVWKTSSVQLSYALNAHLFPEITWIELNELSLQCLVLGIS